MARRKVHPSGGQTMTGVDPSHQGAAGEEETRINVLGSPGEVETDLAMTLKPTPTTKIVQGMKSNYSDATGMDNDQEVFSRLRDNAEKRYGTGDAPMARKSYR